MARIKLLEKHAADGTIPSGLRIQRVKGKGQDAETLPAKFDAIIREAEFKLLDAATDSLRVDVEVHGETIQEREKDIDGTIAQWKTRLSKVKEVTSSQVDNLVEAAAQRLWSNCLRTVPLPEPPSLYKRRLPVNRAKGEKWR